ncbi:CoxG family protein [Deinococcus alpinitundrae]|uniref:CoxG family protein n=1 Tax=Deinococcus alpinitundrae TaxID=468913 RepID=UPI00137A8C8F|nr:carbon monoxide dehydrogenase subunit G [Deinococcus alpinitundrae]
MSPHTFQGSNIVAAPRARVWAMLQDPAVLARIVPGLTDAIQDGENQMRAVLNVNVGPVKGRFKTIVRVLEAQPPAQMDLEVEGKTITGTALLHTQMTFTDLGESTRVDWVASPRLSGLLAGVGGKLIESKARDGSAGQRYADRFFGRLSQEA